MAINPLNPQNLASVWVRNDPSRNGNNKVIVEGAISNNGGTSWSSFGATPNILRDPTITDSFQLFPRVTDAGVAFDRAGNLYTLQVQHTVSNNAGAVVLSRFNTAGVLQDTQTVYQWNQAATGQSGEGDPAAGAGRRRHAEFHRPHDRSGPVQPVRRPRLHRLDRRHAAAEPSARRLPLHQVELVTSTDLARRSAAPLGLNQGGNFGNQRNASPRIAVSQGRADGTGAAAGQVTVIWDDYGTGWLGPPVSIIQARQVFGGGTALGNQVQVATTLVRGQQGAAA